MKIILLTTTICYSVSFNPKRQKKDHLCSSRLVLEISDRPVDNDKNQDRSRQPELGEPEEAIHLCHVFGIRVLVELFDGHGLRRKCMGEREMMRGVNDQNKGLAGGVLPPSLT